MSKTTAPSKVPSQTGGSINRSDLLAAVADITWQLAVVVLIPIFGGYKADAHFDTSPIFTVLGLFIAMAGLLIVVWHQSQRFDPTRHQPKDPHDDT